jgi:translation initiation factor IF-2
VLGAESVATQIGDSFVIGTGGHLWIVISDPTQHNGEYIIVNLTTDEFRAGNDCELNPGDHQWVTEKCFVSFGDARKVTPAENAKITAHMATKVIRKQFPVSASVLQKIVAAGKKSKALPSGFLAYL